MRRRQLIFQIFGTAEHGVYTNPAGATFNAALFYFVSQIVQYLPVLANTEKCAVT